MRAARLRFFKIPLRQTPSTRFLKVIGNFFGKVQKDFF